MKKFTLFIISLLTASFAMADKISPEKAKQNALSFLNQGNTHQKRATGKIEDYQLALSSTGYYVFSNNAGNGYIIAASDDNMTSTVLGYSDSGIFDAQNIPVNMKWWLSEYDQEAQWLAANPGKHLSVHKVAKTEITPLLPSLWNQDAPYWDQCPIQNGSHCYTGCVATAMAQIMYFHKWPESGEGSHSYDWNSQTLSADFSQSTYDWASMTDTYDENSSDAACTAVAKLMSDVGISLDMGYGTESSGTYSTNVAHALQNYFKYSREACLYSRSHYTTDEWEQMIYESLEHSEPIYYAGSGSGGHAFVCDGYNDGYYHFNWGWGGVSNGYFVLSSLDPSVQGWGGSANGYSAGQEVVLNIRPDKDASSKTIAYMASNEEFGLDYDSNYDCYEMSGGFWNYTLETINIILGLEFVDSNGKSEFKFENVTTDLDSYTGWNTYYINKSCFPTADGTYKVYPAYYDVNYKTNNRLHTNTYYNGYCVCNINEGEITISEPSYNADLTCTNIKYNKFYAEKYIPVTTTFKNNGSERYSNDVFLGVYDSENDCFVSYTYGFVDLEPEESCDLTVILQAPSDISKQYTLYVYDAVNYLKGTKINVVSVPTGDFEGMLTSKPVCTVDKYNNVAITCQFSCTSGYEDELIVWFYDAVGDYIDSYLQNGYPLAEGDNTTVTFIGSVPNLEPESTYYYMIQGYLNDYYTFKYGQTEVFLFTTPKQGESTAIQNIESSESDISTPLYNLQGQQISNPVNGQIYIQNRKKVLK